MDCVNIPLLLTRKAEVSTNPGWVTSHYSGWSNFFLSPFCRQYKTIFLCFCNYWFIYWLNQIGCQQFLKKNVLAVMMLGFLIYILLLFHRNKGRESQYMPQSTFRGQHLSSAAHGTLQVQCHLLKWCVYLLFCPNVVIKRGRAIISFLCFFKLNLCLCE